jgi:hypothetical protein
MVLFSLAARRKLRQRTTRASAIHSTRGEPKMNTFYPLIDVAVVLIGRGSRLVLDFKNPWSAFSLPITKLRDRPATIAGGESRESPLDAAIRESVEVLSVPLAPDSLPERIDAEVPPYQQSGRDGLWKRYNFNVYGMTIKFNPRSLAGHEAVWLAPEQILTHQPISPTTSHVINSVSMLTLRRLAA